METPHRNPVLTTSYYFHSKTTMKKSAFTKGAHSDWELIKLYLESNRNNWHKYDKKLAAKIRKELGYVAALAEMLETEQGKREVLEKKFESLQHDWDVIQKFLGKYFMS
jgi:hypothetical protein